MGTIIIIVLIATAAWFFLSGTFNTSFKDPATLRDNELEIAFIELKKKILITSAYEKEQTYEHLYYRIRAVLSQILLRHEHFTLDLDAQGIDVRNMIIQRNYPHLHGTSSNDFFFPSDLPLGSFQSDELLYMCFYLYMGGRIQNIGSIEGSSQTMMKVLNYLISERDYPPAYFLKGFVMKYGSEACGSVRIGDARELLTLAQQKGVGAATLELKNLDNFTQLEQIENVHPKQFHQP